jgi:hypothetical protein
MFEQGSTPALEQRSVGDGDRHFAGGGNWRFVGGGDRRFDPAFGRGPAAPAFEQGSAPAFGSFGRGADIKEKAQELDGLSQVLGEKEEEMCWRTVFTPHVILLGCF